MKLTDKTKKRLTVAGFGLVCVVLVIAIASQFKTEAPKDVTVQPSGTVSDEVNPNTPVIEPTSTPEVNVPPIDQDKASAPPADTGDSTGTEQSIQAEVTKPTEPPKEVLTDPSKTPDGQEVDEDKKPVNSSSADTPKSGDKNEKGQIWFPGFGWVDDEGTNTGTQVGNDDDELTGNKVGSMD